MSLLTTIGKNRAIQKATAQFAVVSALVLGISVVSTTPAQAYLDPGTGSMMLQAIIGAIAGGLVVLKIYWQKIRRFFMPKNSSKSTKNTNLDND